MMLERRFSRTIGGILSRPYHVLLGRCLNILPISRYGQKKFKGSVSNSGLFASIESEKTEDMLHLLLCGRGVVLVDVNVADVKRLIRSAKPIKARLNALSLALPWALWYCLCCTHVIFNRVEPPLKFREGRFCFSVIDLLDLSRPEAVYCFAKLVYQCFFNDF